MVMSDLAELHQELACLLGLTQATVQLARRATALADQENESDLVQVLQRLGGAGEQVQRRCQLLIARHPGLRASRITAASRKIKASVMGYCDEGATMRHVLELLCMAVNRAWARTVELRARNPSDHDQAVADFVDFAVLVQEDCPAAITKACSCLGRLSPDGSPRCGSISLDPMMGLPLVSCT
jgi:hypothetical protein